MGSSITQAPFRAAYFELPAWKTFAATAAAAIIGLLFIVSGVWKITDPLNWATMVAQYRVPAYLSLPFAISLGIGETFGGVLLLVPRFRRWGAWITAALLLVFMIYIGVNYSALKGQDCSCFPLIKRTVGPAFFIGDAIMLALAAMAAWWSRPSHNLRSAALVLAAVAVFSGVSYGVTAARQTGTKAPDTITVAGQPFSLQGGRVLLYFFDPQCMHCDEAARKMAKMQWNDVKIVGVPTDSPQFAASFMKDTGLPGVLTNDLGVLKKTFPFTNGPFAVALENGRQKGAIRNFDGAEPGPALQQLQFTR